MNREQTAAHPSSLRATVPFRFYTSLILQEATGLRAATLAQLAKLLHQVPVSSVHHHTHYFLLQHHYLAPEPSNDFAYWVREILGEQLLGELLASMDTMAYANLEDLRNAIAGTIDTYLVEHPTARLRFVSDGEEFFFLKSTHVVMPTNDVAWTLLELAQAVERVSLHTIYFHLFEARLRMGRASNDFTAWIGEQLGLKELAMRIAQLDPYAHTLEALRAALLAMIRQQLDVT